MKNSRCMDLLDVFPDELPRLPPNREIFFFFFLTYFQAQHLSKAPYGDGTPDLEESKLHLHEILDRDLARVACLRGVHQWYFLIREMEPCECALIINNYIR